jgi:ribosomal protein L13
VAFDIEAGLAYRADKDTVITAKANSAGKVAVSYAQQLSSLAKLTFATEVDAANVASDDHKLGMLLNITA